MTSVIVSVYNEPESVFRRALASVVANHPSELIAVVDGAISRSPLSPGSPCAVALSSAQA